MLPSRPIGLEIQKTSHKKPVKSILAAPQELFERYQEVMISLDMMQAIESRKN